MDITKKRSRKTLIKSNKMFVYPMFILLIPFGLVVVLIAIFAPKNLGIIAIVNITAAVGLYPIMVPDFGRCYLGRIVLSKINNFDDRWDLSLGSNVINFRLFASLRKEYSTHLGYDNLENGKLLDMKLSIRRMGFSSYQLVMYLQNPHPQLIPL